MRGLGQEEGMEGRAWLRKSWVTRCSHSVSGLPSRRRP